MALGKEPEEFGVATARRNFADIVNRVIYRREPTVITKNGRQVAAVVPYEALALLAALEAEADIEKASSALIKPPVLVASKLYGGVYGKEASNPFVKG